MEYGSYEDGEIVDQPKKSGKQANVLPFFGNESTMNLNALILTNIQSSSYFKVNLFKLKTYHEVVDEIYYQVKHLEPWERGSRKNPGVGMCGSVRGVGAGGIVSSAYCLLYKLYTLKLTRKQVNGLINHTDSPYIRGLGFIYIRYTQPPADLYDWYEDYLLDEEEIDIKAGGGQTITIGSLVRLLMVKLDWFSTLFPRIPVPIQKQIEKKLNAYAQENGINWDERPRVEEREERRYGSGSGNSAGGTGGGGKGGSGSGSGEPSRYEGESSSRYERGDRRPNEERSHDRDRERRRERSYDRDRYRDDRRRSPDRDREHHHKHKKSKHKHRSRDRSRDRDRSSDKNYDRKYR